MFVAVGEQTLGRLAEESWNRFEDHDALFFEGAWHRAHTLAGRARHLCGGLISYGVRPGDAVVVMMATCPEVSLVYQALWAAGAVVTPVVFLVSPTELAYILRDSGATTIITTPEFLATVEAAEGDAQVIVVGEDSFASLEQTPEHGPVTRHPSDLAALMYTGGTTGRAKGVLLNHQSLWQVARSLHDFTSQAEVTRSIVPIPLSHAYGLILTIADLHATVPNPTVLMRWFDPAEFLRLAAEHRVQYGAVVPAMLAQLLTEPLERASLPDLSYLTC